MAKEVKGSKTTLSKWLSGFFDQCPIGILLVKISNRKKSWFVVVSKEIEH